MIVTITGAVHARKIPWVEVMTMHSGSDANFANPNETFSTVTHREARSPISTESWSAKIVQSTTAATDRAFHKIGAGRRLRQKPRAMYAMTRMKSNATTIRYAE